MNKLYILMACAIGLLFLQSCEKDEGKLPKISFKSGSNYISADDSVGMQDTLTVGIEAEKTEDRDVLKTFDASGSYDGGTSTSFMNEPISKSQEDKYSKDIQIITRNQAGSEKYTFTVINRDGIKNSVSLTLTVQ